MTSTSPPVARSTGKPPKLKRSLSKGRLANYILTAVTLILLAMLVNTLVTNSRFQWHIVWQYAFNSAILQGLLHTIELTVIAMVAGLILGTLLAVVRLSRNRVLKTAAGLYVWFFRGTPLLVQIIFWYNLAALYPKLTIGIPFGPALATAHVNSLITPWAAAILGLVLNEAAYMSEIVRAGILSIPRGQTEAARSLGMSARQTMTQIVLPQAMRVILPPTGNETVAMLKSTSLVSVIALSELLYATQTIYSANYETIPLLVMASLWYLVLTSVLSVGQGYLERRYNRGERGSGAVASVTMRQRLMGSFFGERTFGSARG